MASIEMRLMAHIMNENNANNEKSAKEVVKSNEKGEKFVH